MNKDNLIKAYWSIISTLELYCKYDRALIKYNKFLSENEIFKRCSMNSFFNILKNENNTKYFLGLPHPNVIQDYVFAHSQINEAINEIIQYVGKINQAQAIIRHHDLINYNRKYTLLLKQAERVQELTVGHDHQLNDYERKGIAFLYQLLDAFNERFHYNLITINQLYDTTLDFDMELEKTPATQTNYNRYNFHYPRSDNSQNNNNNNNNMPSPPQM